MVRKKIALEEATEEVEETADTIAIAIAVEEETTEDTIAVEDTTAEEVAEIEATEEVEETDTTEEVEELEKRIEKVEAKNKELEEKIKALENRTLEDFIVPKEFLKTKKNLELQIKNAEEELTHKPGDKRLKKRIKQLNEILEINNSAIAIYKKDFKIGE